MDKLSGFRNQGTRNAARLGSVLVLLGACPAWADPPSGMVLVADGQFAMGDWFNEGNPDERPVHSVHISPFYIDAREVSAQHYAAGLNWAYTQGLIALIGGRVYPAGGGTDYPYCDTTSSSSYSLIAWNGSTFGVVAGMEDRPVVQVSWYGAAAYCNWRSAMQGRQPCFDLSTWTCDFSKDGFRLPTEAEWEKAAGWDPVQQRHFRFAEHTDGCGANCLDGHRLNCSNSGDPFESGPYPWTTPVGYFNGSTYGGYQTQDAKSYYGCYDMSGNVWEWCYDWYSSAYYADSPDANPTGPASGASRVMRGGSWYNTPIVCRSAMRNSHAPGDRYPNDGFRRAAGLPAPLLGDLDCDGDRDADDVAPFVLALVDPAGHAAQHPNCSVSGADVNQDSVVDGADIKPFIDLLLE